MRQIVNPKVELAMAQPWPIHSATTKLHNGVYRWLFTWNAMILFLGWGIFQDAWEAIFMLAICAIYVAMYFGTPWVMLRAGKVVTRDEVSFGAFLRNPFETLTGEIKGWEALIQVCLIPAAIAGAFAGFWIILAFVR